MATHSSSCFRTNSTMMAAPFTMATIRFSRASTSGMVSRRTWRYDMLLLMYKTRLTRLVVRPRRYHDPRRRAVDPLRRVPEPQPQLPLRHAPVVEQDVLQGRSHGSEYLTPGLWHDFRFLAGFLGHGQPRPARVSVDDRWHVAVQLRRRLRCRDHAESKRSEWPQLSAGHETACVYLLRRRSSERGQVEDRTRD